MFLCLIFRWDFSRLHSGALADGLLTEILLLVLCELTFPHFDESFSQRGNLVIRMLPEPAPHPTSPHDNRMA